MPMGSAQVKSVVQILNAREGRAFEIASLVRPDLHSTP
jgi:hypothetical protein